MLAADKLLLQSQLQQRTIVLREKELHLFNQNFSAVGTQAAVLAGFSMTIFIEITIPDDADWYAKASLQLFTVMSMCANLLVVALTTFSTVWGGIMALKGKEGSMEIAVDGMSQERTFIFRCFALGLLTNLAALLCATCIIMAPSVEAVAACIVVLTVVCVTRYAKRVRQEFHISSVVKFDDLRLSPRSSNSMRNGSSHSMLSSNSPRSRRIAADSQV